MPGWAAAEDDSELRGRPLTCNSTFAQSRALGGADANVITDNGLLIELKSAARSYLLEHRPLQRSGYAVADTNDCFGVTAVVVFAGWWRNKAVWVLGELLDALAGDSVGLAGLRESIAHPLDGQGEHRAPSRTGTFRAVRGSTSHDRGRA